MSGTLKQQQQKEFLVQNLNYNVSSKTLCLWKTNFTEFFWGQSTLMSYHLMAEPMISPVSLPVEVGLQGREHKQREA